MGDDDEFTISDLMASGLFCSSSWARDIERAVQADGARFTHVGKPASPPPRKPRKRKAPTLAGVANQASKAGIEVARYEVELDGKINVVTGKSESTTTSNPWDAIYAADKKRPS